MFAENCGFIHMLMDEWVINLVTVTCQRYDFVYLPYSYGLTSIDANTVSFPVTYTRCHTQTHTKAIRCCFCGKNHPKLLVDRAWFNLPFNLHFTSIAGIKPHRVPTEKLFGNFFFRNELKTIPKGFFFLFYSVLLVTVGVGWMCYRMLTAIRLRLISMPPQTISVHREYACSMFGLAWRCLLSYGRCLWNDMGRLLLALALVCWWYADVTEIRFRAMQIEDRI